MKQQLLKLTCCGLLRWIASFYLVQQRTSDVDHDAFNTYTSTQQTPCTGDRTRCPCRRSARS